MTVGSGTLSVRAPRVNDQRVVDGVRQKFTSEILPPYLRRSKAVSEVLPVLYTIWRYRQLRRAQRTGTPLEAIVGAVPAWARR